LAGPALPIAAGGAAVGLAQADGNGPLVDEVYIPPGRSAYVRATALGDAAGGQLYLVTDTGVRFGIRDTETAGTLGLSSDPVAAPWPVLKVLPQGPELSKENALVAHDGVAAAPTPR
jgi:hypothetical protein